MYVAEPSGDVILGHRLNLGKLVGSESLVSGSGISDRLGNQIQLDTFKKKKKKPTAQKKS